MKWRYLILVAICLLIYNHGVSAIISEGEEYISFGADLNKAERDQMLDQFVPDGRAKIIEVTNAEEYYYLNRYVPKEQIGSKAISSVYLQILSRGTGIQVQTHNITWVTSGMYANAVVTAGIKDVLIKAAAPFPVSGTAALTGILKAFETAQGQSIPSERKEAAYQELVTTGELGEEVGQENAENLVRDVKQEIVEKKVTDPEEIRVIIENHAEQYNINLTEDQVRQISQLMQKIDNLGLNVEEMNQQLKDMGTRVKGIQEEGRKVGGLLAQILNVLQQLLNFIMQIFS